MLDLIAVSLGQALVPLLLSTIITATLKKSGRSQSPLSHQNADCIHSDLLHWEHVDAYRSMAPCIARYDHAAADRCAPILAVLSLCLDSIPDEVAPITVQIYTRRIRRV